jgi:apolipoprotein N-acyltransferase
MKLNDTTAVAILCTLSSGVLYAASRDITPFGPLVLIAPIPILLYALSAVRAWRAFATAFVARGIGATAFIYAYMDALPPSILALATIAASAEFAIVVVLSRIAVQRLPTWAATLSFPVLATATEFLLQLPSPHGTFGALGHALIDVLPLVQVASLGGVAAVSFVAALIPMSIVLLTHAPTHWRSVLIVGATPVFLATVYGFWRLSMPYEDRTRVALASIDALTLRAIEGRL